MQIKGENLSVFDIYDIAFNGTNVTLSDESINKVRETYEKVQKWGNAKEPIYGVNTGFGELVPAIIPPQHKSALQYNLLRTHAAGGGEPFADEIVKAIMTARLNCIIKGHSGTSVEAVNLLKESINRGICPVIPQQGSLGASGDLSPLAHMALPMIGDGYVTYKGEKRKSKEVYDEEHLELLVPGFKEALSLINGTSAMTGVASVAMVKALRLLQLSLFASSNFIQCLGGSTKAYEDSGHSLKNHHGQVRIAASLRNGLTDSTLTHDHKDLMEAITERVGDSTEVVDTQVFLQHAYTLRCIPQILGPVTDTFIFCKRIVEEEINSCNDNPLFFEEAVDSFHGGNFHGQYVAMASDYLNIAVTEIGVLAERQVNRILDPHLNKPLPDFLAHGESGLFCGFEGGQYLATSIASENLDLAAPASIKTIPSNGQNQDVVSMGLNSARRSLQICENVTTILGVLVACCFQASFFVGQDKFNPIVKEINDELGDLLPQYNDSTPINEYLETVREFTNSDVMTKHLDEHFPIENLLT